MTARKRLQRLHELLGVVIDGLDGQPFSWGDGQRSSWTSMLKAAGVTLVSPTQIKKQGYQLKRGAKPVGQAYFAAPIQKWVDLYVLEIQCQKPRKPDEANCWLFLDCMVMTGLPPEKCPNRKHCKQNALHSSNRSIALFYEYDHCETDARTLIVRTVPDYAQGFGWEQADPLFYSYNDGVVTVGRYDGLPRRIPEEALALGFEKAIETPYSANSRPGYLYVSRYPSYPTEFKEAGWYPSVGLPYYVYWDKSSFKWLEVEFDVDDPEYFEAIASGWYPAYKLACEL